MITTRNLRPLTDPERACCDSHYQFAMRFAMVHVHRKARSKRWLTAEEEAIVHISLIGAVQSFDARRGRKITSWIALRIVSGMSDWWRKTNEEASRWCQFGERAEELILDGEQGFRNPIVSTN